VTRITRHFVTVGGRRVHYTRAGDGPPVLMLHASPCSAKVLRLPQTVFAARFTAFAFDTPGFGLSDPLPATPPEIRDFADALVDTMDALGLAEAATYGRHTGAGIAVEFARRHPGRCSMALADGYPVFPAPYSEERLARYLEPIVPRWDGGHLLWLWFRYREQHVFWPWDAHDDAHRSDTDVPDLEFLHRGVVELMEAGDGYRAGYASAFRHEGLALLPELRRPVCFGARPGDSMASTLPLFPASAWTAEMPRDPWAAAVAEREVLERYPAAMTAPEAPGCAAIAGRTTTDYVDLGDSQMLLRSSGDADGGAPLLLLHAIPGSSALHDALIMALGRHRRVLAFDLPGQGESEPAEGFSPSVGGWAGRVRGALDRIGAGAVHVFGAEGGATVAVEFARREPRLVASLTLQSPPALTLDERADLAERYAPAADPVWDGCHLTRVWHHLRDQELWWPWFDRRRERARRHELAISPAQLQARARECLKQPRFYRPAWEAILSYPLLETLASLGRPVNLVTREGDLFAQFAGRAAAVAAPHRVVSVADEPALARAVLAGLDF